MITEQAIVTRSDGKQAEIMLQRTLACGGCELSQGCGTGALGRLLGNRSRPLLIETSHDLKVGDMLLLGLSEVALVKSSLLVYGLPLLGLITAGLLAASVSAPEILVVASSVAGLFAGFKLAAYLSRSLEQDTLTPYIVDIHVNPGTRSGS